MNNTTGTDDGFNPERDVVPDDDVNFNLESLNYITGLKLILTQRTDTVSKSRFNLGRTNVRSY